MPILEMALQAMLRGEGIQGYTCELANSVSASPSCSAKIAQTLRQLTCFNPFADYLKAHSEEILAALHSQADRTLILVSLLVARYEFAFDVISILCRHFHAQDLVPTSLIAKKASEKYMAGEKMLTNALYYLLPMLVEAGLLTRPKVGHYAMVKVAPQTAIALDAYREAFYRWNPTTRHTDLSAHPFFEFVASV